MSSVHFNVRVPMRDGILLSALVARPQGAGPFTAVLTRSCYTKWNGTLSERMHYWVSHGFAFVVQDVRGRGDSDGVFYPLINERLDGRDTIEWVASQPWSDGRVVMVGASYGGWTQLFAACENQSALVAVVPSMTPPDPDRSFPVHHGIPMPSAAAWMASIDGRTNQDLTGCDVSAAFAQLPIIDIDRRIGRELKAWRDWVDTPAASPYWLAQRYQNDLTRSHAAMLHVSGWYDDCLVGALENFSAMTNPDVMRNKPSSQRLVIGPWAHGSIGQRNIGEIDFGINAELNFLDTQRQWFESRLNDIEASDPAVALFVMGRNDWIYENEWPIARTDYVPYFFHSQGSANRRTGDGTLSEAPPSDEPADKFVYDPANPVPYCSHFDWRQVGGPDDFAEIELRDDVLVYTGPLVTDPMLICGPLKVRLYASSSAVDTDWTAKILDVYPDGRAIRLNDGVVRARFRQGADCVKFITPGAVEEFEIDCWATCIELQPGHRIRVEISSSAFGKGDVNMNGGGPIGREAKAVQAQQTIFHDSIRPSCLLLPVIASRHE